MSHCRLKVYYGPEESPTALAESRQENCVRVTAGEVFPLLADAVSSNRAWLQDFAQDEIVISADLYEVILAYQHFRRPSA